MRCRCVEHRLIFQPFTCRRQTRDRVCSRLGKFIDVTLVVLWYREWTLGRICMDDGRLAFFDVSIKDTYKALYHVVLYIVSHYY